ncbi:MAG: hypothetical protein AB8F26_04670 [Phycisphaerales bacterium]
MRFILAAAALVMPIVTPLAADEIRWINPAGGGWDDPANWDLGRIPGVLDTAIFDLATAYTVTFDAQPMFDSIDISKGNIDFELGSIAAICLGTEFGTRSIIVAGTDPDDPILHLRGGIMLTKCPDSDPDTSTPDALLAIGLPDDGRTNGSVLIHDVGTFAPDLDYNTLRVRVKGNGLFHVVSGSFGWSSRFSSSGSVSYRVYAPAAAIIDGDLIGSSTQGDGNWLINGQIGGFDDQLEFGHATVTSGTELYTEDLYPGVTTLEKATEFGGDYIYPGTMVFKEPGNIVNGVSLDRTHLIIEYQESPTTAWILNGSLARFDPKISILAAGADDFPLPPAVAVIAEGGIQADHVTIELGDIELPFASDSELMTVRHLGQTTIWLQMAPPGWCRADQDFNGVVNFFDIVAFIDHYNNGQPWAQMNQEQRLNFFDVADYIALFNAGCP